MYLFMSKPDVYACIYLCLNRVCKHVLQNIDQTDAKAPVAAQESSDLDDEFLDCPENTDFISVKDMKSGKQKQVTLLIFFH